MKKLLVALMMFAFLFSCAHYTPTTKKYVFAKKFRINASRVEAEMFVKSYLYNNFIEYWIPTYTTGIQYNFKIESNAYADCGTGEFDGSTYRNVYFLRINKYGDGTEIEITSTHTTSLNQWNSARVDCISTGEFESKFGEKLYNHFNDKK